jgi:cytoskeletal protein RodZ
MNQNKSSSSAFYKIGFFVLFSIFLLAAGGFTVWFFLSQNKKLDNNTSKPIPSIKTNPSSTPSKTTPTITSSPTVTEPSPTTNTQSDLDQIRSAMASKYSKNPEDVIINISANNSTHARGGVSFAGEMGGGWFLAAKDASSQWQIVDDGNGTIMCSIIEPYDFPTTMLSECVDDLGNLVYR